MAPNPRTSGLYTNQTLEKFATILDPGDAEQPILPASIRGAVHQFLTELQCEAELREFGLKPRRTAIFSGPPGCGKTTLAHHLAARLDQPLVLIDMAQVVSDSLGGTGQNLSAVMTACEKYASECVVLFDEFDAVGTQRSAGATNCDAEMNRVVISLLQRFDRFSGTLIAATNQGAEIDQALWRRFGMHLDIALPDEDCRWAILKKYLLPLTIADSDFDLLAQITVGASPALLRQLMEAIKRDIVMSRRFERDMTAPAVFARAVAGIKPHAAVRLPPLWADSDRMMHAIAEISWPPERDEKQ